MGESGSTRYRVLGPVSAGQHGSDLPLGGPQQRLTLALLLVDFGKPVSFERLIDSIWGARPPPTARKTLQVYVSHLRGTLGDRSIETGAGGYRIATGRLDAREFEDLAARGRRTADPREGSEILRDALGLWMGSPYSGLDGNQSLQAEITRLDEMRVSTLEDRIDAELEAGGGSELIGELESLVREYPWRERFRGHLMLALYRAGRQADALRVFQRTRHQLVEELGIEPGPELWQLEQRILQQAPDLMAAGVGTEHGPVRAIRGYEIREETGRGPLARIYRAYDRGSNRMVTVEVIHRHVASRAAFVERFEPAAEQVARLAHPQIQPLEDYWRDPEGAYLVYPWMEGGTLRDTLDGRRPWALSPALKLIEEIGSALAHAHRSGVVHGALKPENVLFDAQGASCLAGFSPGIPAGSYVAPEIRRGEEPTPRSDVYSFGLMVHELLTGSVPHEHRLSRMLSPELRQVISRATALDPDERYAKAEDLVAAIRDAAGQNAGDGQATAVAQPPVRNPYKGLRAFRESDADDFFGRGGLIELTLAKASVHRLVAVVGPSGSGKSSLVNAGVLPRLRRGLRGRPCLITQMFPGNYPFEELESALRRVAVSWPESGLFEQLTADSRGLVRVVEHILPDDDSQLVLVVDQLEELFSLPVDEATRALFLDSLTTLVDGLHSRVLVMVTLRADFFDQPLKYPRFGELLDRGLVPVTSPSRRDLFEAVTRPAGAVGLVMEPGLVSEIVADTERQPGALPMLQFLLTEMVEDGNGSHLTVDEYHRQGGVDGAIGSKAEEVYLAQPPAGKQALEQAFLRLVRVDEQDAYTRRRVRQAELAALEVDQAALNSVLQALAAHRLVTFDRDPITRGGTVEIAHEALLEGWTRLRSWVYDRRQDLLQHRRYTQARQEWLGNRSENAFLLSGGRLAQFEVWAGSTDLRLTPEETAFLERSRAVQDQQERRRRSRRIGLAAILVTLACLGVGVALFALQQRAETQREGILRMARTALSTVEQNPEGALLVSLAAADRSLDLDGRLPDDVVQLMHEALMRLRVLATIPEGGTMALDPYEERLAIGGPDGSITLWDPSDGRPLGELEGAWDALDALAFATQGPIPYTRPFVGSHDLVGIDVTGRGYGWDVQEATRASPYQLGLEGAGWWMDVSGDGAFLATGRDGVDRVSVRNAETFRLAIGPPWAREELEVANPTDGQFSPDGSTLAVSTAQGKVVFFDVPPQATQRGWTPSWPDRAEWNSPEGTKVNQIAWSPRGDRLAVATDRAGTVILDPEGRLPLLSIPGNFAIAVDFDATGRRLVIGYSDGTARVVDAVTGAEVSPLQGHARGISQVLFAGEGERVITTSTDGTTRILDATPTGQRQLHTLEEPVPGRTSYLDFSADGSLLLTQSEAGVATIWDTSSWQPVADIDGLPSLSGQNDISPDGATVALAQGESTGEAENLLDANLRTAPTSTGIYDVATGEEILYLGGHRGHVVGRAFDPDGRRLVTAGLGGIIRLWDLENGTALDSDESEHGLMTGISFHPSGHSLVVGNQDGTFSIWRVSDGELETVRTIRAHDCSNQRLCVVFVRFSRDGERIASTSSEGPGAVWNQDGELITRLMGHTSMTWGLSWTAEDDQLVTTSIDGTIRFWDPETGDQRMNLTAVSTPFGVDVSPQNVMAVAASELQGRTFLYTLDQEELLRMARERVTRALSQEECAAFDIDPCRISTPQQSFPIQARTGQP